MNTAAINVLLRPNGFVGFQRSAANTIVLNFLITDSNVEVAFISDPYWMEPNVVQTAKLPLRLIRLRYARSTTARKSRSIGNTITSGRKYLSPSNRVHVPIRKSGSKNYPPGSDKFILSFPPRAAGLFVFVSAETARWISFFLLRSSNETHSVRRIRYYL